VADQPEQRIGEHARRKDERAQVERAGAHRADNQNRTDEGHRPGEDPEREAQHPPPQRIERVVEKGRGAAHHRRG
jgi:hypothetical protein